MSRKRNLLFLAVPTGFVLNKCVLWLQTRSYFTGNFWYLTLSSVHWNQGLNFAKFFTPWSCLLFTAVLPKRLYKTHTPWNVSSSSVFILVILGTSFTSISQATGKLALPLIDSTSSILVPRASSSWLRRQLWRLWQLWDLEWNEPARNREPALFPGFCKTLA